MVSNQAKVRLATPIRTAHCQCAEGEAALDPTPCQRTEQVAHCVNGGFIGIGWRIEALARA